MVGEMEGWRKGLSGREEKVVHGGAQTRPWRGAKVADSGHSGQSGAVVGGDCPFWCCSFLSERRSSREAEKSAIAVLHDEAAGPRLLREPPCIAAPSGEPRIWYQETSVLCPQVPRMPARAG
jgi:hypothetical protein